MRARESMVWAVMRARICFEERAQSNTRAHTHTATTHTYMHTHKNGAHAHTPLLLPLPCPCRRGESEAPILFGSPKEHPESVRARVCVLVCVLGEGCMCVCAHV